MRAQVPLGPYLRSCAKSQWFENVVFGRTYIGALQNEQLKKQDGVTEDFAAYVESSNTREDNGHRIGYVGEEGRHYRALSFG